MGSETTSNIPKEVDQRWFDSCSSRIFVGSKRDRGADDRHRCPPVFFVNVSLFILF